MRLKTDSRSEAGRNETLVRFFTKAERADIPSPSSPVPEAEWSAAANSTLMLHHAGLLCVGLGDEAKVTGQTLRAAAGTAVRTLQKAGRRRAALDLRNYAKWTGAAAEGAVLGEYAFQDFKKAKVTVMESVRLIVKERDLTAAREAGRRG